MTGPTFYDSVMRMARGYDNRLATLGHRPAHLQFSIEGRRFLYCYIQKNACSAMKRLLLATVHRSPDDWRGKFDFEPFRYRFGGAAAVEAFHCRFFIYRDPVDRIASLFVNKFIQRRGNIDLFDQYAATTGQAPESATFEEFVCDYVMRDEAETDTHCHSQYSRLLPIRYTHAIPMESLFEEMNKLLGTDFAQRFFREKTNAITEPRYDDPSHALPADKLHERYVSSSRLPSTQALVTDQLREVLNHRFADDYRMMSDLQHPIGRFARLSARRIAHKLAAARKRIAHARGRSRQLVSRLQMHASESNHGRRPADHRQARPPDRDDSVS